MRNTAYDSIKKQQSSPNLGLDLTLPFYIDRKFRPKPIKSPRCLIPSDRRFKEISHYCSLNTSANVSPRIFAHKKPQQSFPSQLAIPVFHKKMSMQWQFNDTQNFKQKLKTLLRKYYEIQKHQKEYLNKKVKKEKILHLVKISQSFQQLLQSNKKLYQSIKHHCQHEKLSEIMEQEYEDCTKEEVQELKKSKIFSTFVKKFIETDSMKQNSVEGLEKRLSEKIESLFTNEILRNPSLLKSRSSKQTISKDPFYGEDMLIFAKTFSSMSKNDEQSQSTFSNIRISHNIMKKLSSLKSSLRGSERGSRKGSRQHIQQLKIDYFDEESNRLLEQRLANAESGKDKFYEVIKQIIQRKRQQQNGDINVRKLELLSQDQQKTERKEKSDPPKNEGKRSKTSRILNNYNSEKNPMSSTQSSFYRESRKSSNVKLRNIEDVTKVKRQKMKEEEKVNEIIKKKNDKGKESRQKERQSRASNTSLMRRTFNNKFTPKYSKQLKQNVKPKSQHKKIGLNYNKFLGKIIKAAENEKAGIKIQKFRKYHKFATRQAFLSKDKNKINIHSNIEDDAYIKGWLKQLERQQAINQTSGQSSSASENSNENENQNENENENENSQESLTENEIRSRMTKYEEARMMYNMRNVKIKQPSYIHYGKQEQSNIRMKKRLSIYRESRDNEKNHVSVELASPIIPKNYSRISASLIKKEVVEEQEESQMLTRNRIESSRFIKTQAHKKKISFTRSPENMSEISLNRLTKFQEFDLRAVKSNITRYLKKFMLRNQKAKELYNFLMFIQQSRKSAIEKQELNYSLDVLKIQKQNEELEQLLGSLTIKIDDYEGCRSMYDHYKFNERGYEAENNDFIERLDARVIELIEWNEDDIAKPVEDLKQCSVKQIIDVPIFRK